MTKWHRIVSPSDEMQHWHGDRAPMQEEIDELVEEWMARQEPMEVPLTVTDYLLVQRHSIFGWKTIEIVHLIEMLAPKIPE